MRNTPGLLLLSLLIGSALWVFVTDVENPTRVDVLPAKVPVEAVNVAPELAVANTLPAVQVRVIASEDRWEELTSANFRAFVDLSGLGAREQRVEVTIDVQGIGGVRVAETIPPSVLVNLEDFVSREVPVVVRLVGTTRLGYDVQSVQPERSTVQVSGPESLVELVREAVADVAVSGLSLGLDQTVSLTPRGARGGDVVGVRMDPPSLRVTVDVQQTVLTRTLPLAAVITGEPALGFRVTGVDVQPSTATVTGTIEALQGLDALPLATVDITGAADGALTQTVAAEPLPGVGGAADVTATVTVRVSAIEGTTRLSVAPEAAGVEQGLVARLAPPSVVLVLAGPLPLLNPLGPSDVRVTVDAAGLPVGTVELAVSVAVPAGISVVTVQPQTLSVTLEPAP